jgi:hypothetical protein
MRRKSDENPGGSGRRQQKVVDAAAGWRSPATAVIGVLGFMLLRSYDVHVGSPEWLVLPLIYLIPLLTGYLSGWLGVVTSVVLFPGAAVASNALDSAAWTGHDAIIGYFGFVLAATIGALGAVLVRGARRGWRDLFST